MAKNKQAQEEPQIESQPTGLEAFLKKYRNLIEWCIIGILVIVLGIMAINKWVIAPARQEARSQSFVAEQKFRAGDYQTALEGDGNNLGFAQVLDQYGRKADKAINLYAGLCCLNLGNNEEAIEYLKKYNGKDKILKGKALCCIGDAYANMGNNDAALAYFKKAAAAEDNLYRATYLFKEGLIYEEMGKDEDALKCYKEIEVKYPQSYEAYEIAKYISRIENK